MSNIELGCGLISIGREWGTTPQVPSEKEAISFLEFAYQSGIRFFDTAPSYGLSEKRLGQFLKKLTPTERQNVVVATKFGEHWDKERQQPYTDHSIEALRRSLDNSMHHLGQIAILQLHKATPELIDDPDVIQAFSYALELGIQKRGVSASDIATAYSTIDNPKYSVVQIPYNHKNSHFTEVIDEGNDKNKFFMINRPFDMGEISRQSSIMKKEAFIKKQAFQFILKENFQGIILTGTSNREHLEENIAAFTLAQS